MPDISMCVNRECELRTQCFRYRAKPSDWQTYSSFDGGQDCEYFMEIYNEDRVRPIEDIETPKI